MFKRFIVIITIWLILAIVPTIIASERAYQQALDTIATAVKASLVADENPGNTRLWFNNSALQRLPPEIAQLTDLDGLDLSYTAITTFPPEIAQLTNLQTLNLSNMPISTLPAEIGQLTNLNTLILSNTQITALPSEFGQLTNLNTLILSNTQITALPHEIAHLTYLNTINLSNTPISTLPPEIGQLTNLTSLTLSNTQITALPPEIGNLTRLVYVELSNTPISTLPPEIGQLTHLAWLILSNTQITALPPEIGQLTSLRELDISNTQITALTPEIGLLTKLGSLDLSNTQITALPPEIGQLTSLRELDISNTQITALTPEIGLLTRLGSLDLSNTQITALPPEIGLLTRLGSLDLSNTPIKALPPETSQHPLYSLDISNTAIEQIPTQIEKIDFLFADGSQLSELPNGQRPHFISFENTPLARRSLTTVFGGVIGALVLIVGSLGFIRKRSRHAQQVVPASIATKTKQHKHFTVYRWRILAWLMACAVCSIPFGMYFAEDKYWSYGLPTTPNESLLLLMIMAYLVAYVLTVHATVSVARANQQEHRIYGDISPFRTLGAWRNLCQQTWGWYLALVIPRYGIAYGAVQVFYTFFDPECSTLNGFRILFRPYCYTVNGNQFYPQWETAVVALAVLGLLALVECGFISAVACFATRTKGVLVRRAIGAVVAVAIITAIGIQPIVGQLAYRLLNETPDRWLGSYGYSMIEGTTFDKNFDDLKPWLDTHVILASLVDNGILLSTSIMRPDAFTNWRGHNDLDQVAWLLHHVILGGVSALLLVAGSGGYLLRVRQRERALNKLTLTTRDNHA